MNQDPILLRTLVAVGWIFLVGLDNHRIFLNLHKHGVRSCNDTFLKKDDENVIMQDLTP